MTEEKEQGQKNHGVNLSRRIFVKAALVTAAVGTTFGISKKLVSMSAEDSLNKAHLKDEVQQDKIMRGKEYVLMSDEYKRDFINVVINNYKYEG